MAAYAALTSLMRILEQIQHHPRPPITLEKEQMESLCENVSFLQDFLENYSHGGGCKEAQGLLETQIADAAYAAEDIIESRVVDIILAGKKSTNNLFRQALHTVDLILAGKKTTNNLFLQALQKVIEDMDLIKKEVIKIQEKKGINYQLPRNISLSVIGSSTVPPRTRKNAMVGFDDVLVEIMDRLARQQRNRQILPIVGMGGIGKTTLARNVYDNPFIVQHFHIRIWVTISQEYSVLKILLDALFCQRKTDSDGDLVKFNDNMSQLSEDELGGMLHKSLSGRTYLIIMDDMWSIEVWDEVKMFFPDNNNGSRIIITTRISNVALCFSSYNLEMKFLDEDTSWNLLCKNVFPQDDCPLELNEIGKRIAKNCKGLPLSIVVIGGLLAKSEKTREYWEYVAENLNSIITLEDNEYCLKILYLSYNHLPVYLKPCFLYMGVFFEDTEIRVSSLIKLWVAEGILKPIKAKSLEVAAEEYLKDLIDRNLILVHKWGSSGKIKFCKIHDHLRDLCLREAQKENFLWVVSVDNFDSLEGIHSQRHISIHQSTLTRQYIKARHALPSASLTRSLICNFNGVLPFLTPRLLRVFKEVDRYLYLEEKENIYTLEEIFQLINSRYLAFEADWNSISIFPSSIHLLWNLQTLIVKATWVSGHPIVAPPEIWEMSQLRHVEFDTLSLPNPPNLPIHEEDGFILRNLQMLLGIKNFRLSEEVIKRIPNIKKLQVCYDDFPKRWSHNYCLNNLGSLNQLESLTCIFPSENKLNHRIELLQSLAFPHSLKKLTLHRSCLLWEDMTMIGSLPHLEVLKLRYGSFDGPEWNPVEGEFLCLKFLRIEWCNDLVYWMANNTHFPRLEHLVLEGLYKLKEIPLDIGEIPTLRSIELVYCSNSAVISAKNIVEQLEENLGNVELQVRVVFFENSELESLASNNFQVETRFER